MGHLRMSPSSKRSFELGVLLGLLVLSGCSNSGGLPSNGCIPYADITAKVGAQTLYLSNCGGVGNGPLNVVSLRQGQRVTIRVTHVLNAGPIDLSSDEPKVVEFKGRTLIAADPGTALVTMSGLPCAYASGLVCPLLRINVS